MVVQDVKSPARYNEVQTETAGATSSIMHAKKAFKNSFMGGTTSPFSQKEIRNKDLPLSSTPPNKQGPMSSQNLLQKKDRVKPSSFL